MTGRRLWRWRRDLKPRRGLPVTRFRGVIIRPLGHANPAWQITGRPQRIQSLPIRGSREWSGVNDRIQAYALDIEYQSSKAPLT